MLDRGRPLNTHSYRQESLRELGRAALRAARGQMQDGATQAMSGYIVEERQRNRCPRPASLRNLVRHGGYDYCREGRCFSDRPGFGM
jgi:hypothetical protein